MRWKVKVTDIIPRNTVEILHQDWHGRWGGIARREKYEILQVLPHYVLCRSVKGGYRECFTWHQLYEGRVIDLEELERRVKHV